jgi:parvulin-like peptidyl-prolyl isomerase
VPGHWVGPIKSPYGFHLVYVTEIEPARLPPFEVVRDKVQREWFASRRTAVLEEEYEKLRSRFNVRVEGEASGPAQQ